MKMKFAGLSFFDEERNTVMQFWEIFTVTMRFLDLPKKKKKKVKKNVEIKKI
jgi:hypothetical protein